VLSGEATNTNFIVFGAKHSKNFKLNSGEHKEYKKRMDICVIYFASLNELILFPLTSNNSNRIGGVMVSVLASNMT
jgi:hypothetical protein